MQVTKEGLNRGSQMMWQEIELWRKEFRAKVPAPKEPTFLELFECAFEDPNFSKAIITEAMETKQEHVSLDKYMLILLSPVCARTMEKYHGQRKDWEKKEAVILSSMIYACQGIVDAVTINRISTVEFAKRLEDWMNQFMFAKHRTQG